MPQYFETVFRYIINNINDGSADDLKKIAKESLSEKEWNFVMTLAEKLRKEGFEKGFQQGFRLGFQQGFLLGFRQGLIERIELDVSFKFANDASKIVPLIYQIKDTSLLKAVKSAVFTAKTADELIDIIKGLQ